MCWEGQTRPLVLVPATSQYPLPRLHISDTIRDALNKLLERRCICDIKDCKFLAVAVHMCMSARAHMWKRVPRGSSGFLILSKCLWGVGDEKMRKMITSLFVVTVLLTSTFLNLGFVNAELDPEAQKNGAEALLGILGNTHDTVKELLDSVDEVPEDAQEAFDEAQTLRNLAQDYYDAGEYSESIDASTDALNKYGMVIEIISEQEETEDDESEEENESDWYGLFVSYEKARDRYEKLMEILEDLQNAGLDVSEPLSLLEQAGELLDTYGTQLDEGDFEGAEETRSIVQDLLGEAKGLLQSISNQKKNEMTQEFISMTSDRIQRLSEKLEAFLSAQGVSEEEAHALVDEFFALLDELEAFGDDPSEEELDEVIDELDEIVREAEKILEEKAKLSDDIVRKLYDIGKQESRAARYEAKIQMLIGKGADIGELTSMLDNAKALLDDATQLLQEDEIEGAEEKIEEADEMLDELDDLIDELEEQVEDSEEEQEELEEKKSEILEKIQRLRERIRESEVDASDLEEELDQLEGKLQDATTEDEIDEIEEDLDTIEEQLEDLLEANETEEEHEEEESEEKPEEESEEEPPETTG